MTQRFKENDSTELDIIGLFQPTLDALGADRDAFFADAFISPFLGDVLFTLNRDPLADVITGDVYRDSFPAIHDLFTRPGTFEFYLAVFRKIFTADTDISFEVPGPGQLNITVNAITYETFKLLDREIIADAYQYFPLITSDDNVYILGQGVKGIKTQAEMDGLIVELSAYGVFTQVTLIIP